MSDLLNQASLVMIPSGYKEDVVYSQIPTDGSGDLSFTRASNGTRVNSAGLVEVCPWNLLEQSETFDNGYWNKGAASITANATTAPNGTTTADKFNEIATTDTHQIYTTFVGNTGVATLFIYAKKAERSAIQITSDQATDPAAIFNLDTGVIYSSSNCTAFIESVGNGWYKCGVTYTIDQTTTYPVFRVADSSFNTVYAGTANYGIYIWGAQLNIGSTAKPYFPTTDRLNVPRLTYQNGGGGCPSLLLEKQSTNLITYSEDISNSFPTQSQVTITSNNTTSPDGTQNADLLKFDTTTAYILRNQTVNPLTTYTMSVFVKNNNFTSGQLLTFNMSDGVIGGLSAQINVVAKTATFSAPPSAYTSVSGKVLDYGNGWFRVSVTGTSVSGGAGWYEFAASGVTNSCFIWGWSLEVSSYPTSYIPTTSSSATRVADACFKTGISSLIGQTEGTLYFELQRDNTDNDTRLQISDGSGLNWLFVSIETGLNPRAYCNVGGVNQFSVYGSAVSNSTHKVALAYKSNDFKVYIDGVASITQTSGSVPACNRIDVGSASPNGPVVSTSLIKEVVLFPTRLTNAELASLTTL